MGKRRDFHSSRSVPDIIALAKVLELDANEIFGCHTRASQREDAIKPLNHRPLTDYNMSEQTEETFSRSSLRCELKNMCFVDELK